MSHFAGRLFRISCAAALLAVFATSCDLPLDPEDTLERVRGGTLRVGVSEHPPWVRRGDVEPVGLEADLVREFARELQSKVHWQWGTEQHLLQLLENHSIDVVAAGLTEETPWKSRVGLTKPYANTPEPHVLAVAPGENGFLRALESFLFRRQQNARQNLSRQPGVR